jgi:hypothetical protein
MSRLETAGNLMQSYFVRAVSLLFDNLYSFFQTTRAGSWSA